MLSYPIRVNSVHRGAVESAMMDEILSSFPQIQGSVPVDELREMNAGVHPMGRFVAPEEVASGVVYLASTAASYVHGDAMHVDCGYSAA